MADEVFLFDVGKKEYGDAALLRIGGRDILIDGAHPGKQDGDAFHPSIPTQLEGATGRADGVVDLLIVSHAHLDHIGCLPNLVSNGLLRPAWALVPDPGLAWGRFEDDAIDAGADERVRAVLAALHEERPNPLATDDELETLLVDALNQEDRYIAMLDTLAADGTNVVRFRVDSHRALLDEFADIGMKLLGPSNPLLFLAAKAIEANRERDTRSLVDAVHADAPISAVGLLRRALDTVAELDSERDRPGHLVNLQSIAVAFDHGGRKILFSGDMQLADPQTSSERMQAEVRKLRRAIARGAPYDFVKIGHHGSPNAFDESVFDELGDTRAFGIIAGEDSKEHPHVDVLSVLDAHRSAIRWARTDRQGAVSISLGNTVRWTKTRGEFNDEEPNSLDRPGSVEEAEGEAESGEIEPAGPSARPSVRVEEGGDVVEVVARVPKGTKVTISIEVDGTTGATGETRGARTTREIASTGEVPTRRSSSRALDGIALGGGRRLPALLWATSPDRLASNIGEAETEAVLRSVRSAGHEVVELDPGMSPLRAVERVRSSVRRREPAGVVLLGGHDVVPSLRVDCLTPELRARVGAAGDPDNWIVWSDDAYGDRDGDSVPDLPVSRIPDAHSSELVLTAIQVAPAAARPSHSGVRNVRRPFADDVFGLLTNNVDLIRSAPHPQREEANRPTGVDGNLVYLMLHGDWNDGSSFWGEDVPDDAAAVHVDHIRDDRVDTVFTGCCWGALVCDKPASRVRSGEAVEPKTPARSIALRFLSSGARAYVGCTGAHYSPSRPPYDYYGGPLHRSFWRRFVAGAAPAAALHGAKLEYATGIPVRQRRLSGRAVEMKVWRQFTCLGLGW